MLHGMLFSRYDLHTFFHYLQQLFLIEPHRVIFVVSGTAYSNDVIPGQSVLPQEWQFKTFCQIVEILYECILKIFFGASLLPGDYFAKS